MDASGKLAIFDVDGTLLDTLPDIALAVNTARRSFSLEPIAEDAVRRAVGNGQRRLIERTIPEPHIPFDAKFRAEAEAYSRNLRVGTRAYDGIDEVLRTLVADGWKLAVFSNKGDADTVSLISLMGWKDLFSFVHGKRDGLPLKPDPYVINEAICETGSLRGRTWMIGDNYTDIKAGCAAGVKTCFCQWGYGSLGELTPTATASTPRDLPRILDDGFQCYAGIGKPHGYCTIK